MVYIIAQIFGICATISCFVMPLFKKKWQILAVAIVNNLFIGLNFILLGEIVSGLMCLFGITQCVLGIYHVMRDKPVPVAETVMYTIVGIAMSLGGLTKIIGILPVIAVVSYNISVYVRNEQRVRTFLLINMGAWVLYEALIMSTSIFGHAVGFISTALALWKYRNKGNTAEINADNSVETNN